MFRKGRKWAKRGNDQVEEIEPSHICALCIRWPSHNSTDNRYESKMGQFAIFLQILVLFMAIDATGVVIETKEPQAATKHKIDGERML